MIRLERPLVVPKRLLTKGQSRANQHRAEYEANPGNFLSGKWTVQYDESVYSTVAVKKSLAKMHNCKCCYCEQKLPLDVEHFRPKGGAQQSVDHKMEKPGYFWLAYCWDNLLLACQRCNRNNKRNLFPLQNPRKRACPPDYKVEDEKPLFIDPSRQNPRRHIRFENEVPKGRTRAGCITIKGIGLASPQLMGYRRDKIADLNIRLEYIKWASQHPDDAEIQAKVTEFRQYIKSAIQPNAEFSSMVIDYLSSLGTAMEAIR